jgi:hypothetical protein
MATEDFSFIPRNKIWRFPASFFLLAGAQKPFFFGKNFKQHIAQCLPQVPKS